MKQHDACIILIRQLQNKVEKQLNYAMQSHDITMTQAATLAAIAECPKKQIPLKQLEKKLQLSQSVTAGIVSRLEQKKLLESFGDTTDKRIKIVKITTSGEQICQKAQKTMSEIEKTFAQSFTAEEYKELKKLLSKAINT